MRYLITITLDFNAIRKLSWCEGKYANLHGAFWTIKISFEYKRIYQYGITEPLGEFKKIIEKEIIEQLDYKYLNDVIDIPTIERIIFWIWNRLIAIYPNLVAIEIFKDSISSIKLERGNVVSVSNKEKKIKKEMK